jgi:hypothetical protein
MSAVTSGSVVRGRVAAVVNGGEHCASAGGIAVVTSGSGAANVVAALDGRGAC